MKASEGYVWVQACWNNDQGNFYGELFRIEIDDEITVDFNIFEGAKVELFLQGANHARFELGGEIFFIYEYHRWLGSMAWDGLLMKKEDALRLLKTAAKVGFTEMEWISESPYIKAFREAQGKNQEQGTLL